MKSKEHTSWRIIILLLFILTALPLATAPPLATAAELIHDDAIVLAAIPPEVNPIAEKSYILAWTSTENWLGENKEFIVFCLKLYYR